MKRFTHTALVLLANLCLACADVPRKPNIILIMVDDLGYHDLSSYGHPKIKTPAIDKLAQSGVRLTNFHAGASVCTPSRMALLTGAYPVRLGWEKGVVGYLMNKGEGLSPDALTIAEVFQYSGYNTAISGKWHLGKEAPFSPLNQGFESAYYLKMSNNQTDKLWRGDVLVEDPFENRLLTEKFTNEAIRYIRENRNESFFLYLPYTAPHFPVEPHPDWEGKSEYGKYGDVVEELDFSVGRIVESLEESSIRDNTIVIFCSDNGPQEGQMALAKPFKGKKWSALEGGTRVPCVISWPGTIPSAQQCDALISAMDLLPSLAYACGINLEAMSTDAPKIDGLNVWGTLLAEDGFKHPRNELLHWHGRDGFHAIQLNDWKLFINGAHAKVTGHAPSEESSPPALFNLSEDREEQFDLSDKHPQLVKRLSSLADRRLKSMQAGMVKLGQANE